MSLSRLEKPKRKVITAADVAAEERALRLERWAAEKLPAMLDLLAAEMRISPARVMSFIAQVTARWPLHLTHVECAFWLYDHQDATTADVAQWLLDSFTYYDHDRGQWLVQLFTDEEPEPRTGL